MGILYARFMSSTPKLKRIGQDFLEQHIYMNKNKLYDVVAAMNGEEYPKEALTANLELRVTLLKLWDSESPDFQKIGARVSQLGNWGHREFAEEFERLEIAIEEATIKSGLQFPREDLLMRIQGKCLLALYKKVATLMENTLEPAENAFEEEPNAKDKRERQNSWSPGLFPERNPDEPAAKSHKSDSSEPAEEEKSSGDFKRSP